MKVLKRISISIIALLITAVCYGQDPVLEQEVNYGEELAKVGPNRLHYHHFYMGYGFSVGKPEAVGSPIKYGLSGDFEMGYRYKLRVCNFYAIGIQVYYSFTNYNIKQDSTKTFANNILHKKELLSLNNFGAGFYNRFNIGKRGNSIGKYLDLGVYGEWRFFSEHFMKDEMSNGNIVKTTVSRLTYLEDFNYGAYAQIGFKSFAIYAKYRFSDMFNSTVNYAEMPRLVVGVQLQIGVH